MSLTAFMAALTHASVTFECPQTKLAIKLRAPSNLDVDNAEAAVAQRWDGGERTLREVTYPSYRDDVDRELLATLTTHGGEHLGREAIGALSEETFEAWVDQLEQLRKNTTLDMSGDEILAAVEDLKKKQDGLADTLNTYAPAKLRALLRCSVGLLSNSPTQS